MIKKSAESIFQQRIYISHTDCGGIVYHTNYLVFAEHARQEFLRCHLKHGLKKEGAFVVNRLNAHYRNPAYLDDLLTIKTKIQSCSMFACWMQQEIEREKTPLFSMGIKLGFVQKVGRMQPLPRPLYETFLSLIE